MTMMARRLQILSTLYSSRFWFMLAVCYVIQSIGILTFFIPTSRWISQYPIGICVNLLSILD